MYTVRWTRPALDRLAELWLEATDRDALTAAVNEIDRVLARAPREQGESRAGDDRIAFHPPAVVYFRVNDGDLAVTVLRLDRIR